MKGLTRDRSISVLLVAPSIILIAVFVYGFIGFTGFSSLTKWDSFEPDFTFVGLRNFAKLFGTMPTDRFLCDLRNTVTFTVLFLIACIVIGFLLAVLLDRHVKGEGIFRNIFLFPMAISYIVTGVAWRWILSPGNAQAGATGINQLFDRLGLGFLKWGWFTDPTILYIHPESGFGTFLGHIGLGGLASPYIGISVAMISVVLAATWQMSGYTMAMYLAALRGIPVEMREAARVDGATEFQVYRRVIIPMIRPVTLSALIVLGHISLKIFDLVVSMTGPGPAFATDVPAFYMWDTTFRGNNFAQGAAIAMILLVLVAVLIIPYLVSTNRKEVHR
jgi:glucose/mannose transport system permease protein